MPLVCHSAYHIKSRITSYLYSSLPAACFLLLAAGRPNPILSSTRTYTSPYISQTRNMNTSMVKSKFLSHPGDLGVVAVGFAGGQV